MIIDLSGVWSLSTPEFALHATIPGDNISALLARALIPDPYRKDNEQAIQLWREKTWVFSRIFDVEAGLLASPIIDLYVESLDTVATLSLNGHPLCTHCNQFVPLRVDLKPYLVAGTNTLSIAFTPAHHEAARRAALAANVLGADIAAPISDNNRIPAMNFLRKVQCHAGWDWGPCLLVSGIYRAIRIEAIEHPVIDQLYATPRKVTGGWEIPVSVTLTHPIEQPTAQPAVTLTLEQTSAPLVMPVDAAGKTFEHTFFIDDADARLWFPAGSGAQELYKLNARMIDSERTLTLGLRTLEIRREPDADGTSFTVVVNGLPVFCRGANWIPIDALPLRQTPERYTQLLEDARAANMNMLRIWGGGQWEPQHFYDECARLGILLWHDCMFACMHYPAMESFFAEIREELDYQIRRLAHHPAIALWCGDNECFGLCAGGDGEADPVLAANYHRFADVVAQSVKEADPSRLFWPSSPCNGENSPPGSWHDDTIGDMHFWKVWHGAMPFEAYQTVRPRFCSEFGFQAFPTAYTTEWFTQGEPCTADSPIVLNHQKNTGGNDRIAAMITRYLLPETLDPKTLPLSAWVYLSQVAQALAIETAIKAWRTTKPRCMGTLYWQLNDNWPSISWSSIDSFGLWKILHYRARHFYAPIAAFVTEDTEKHQLRILCLNDTPTAVTGVLSVQTWSYAGELRATQHLELELVTDRAVCAATLPALEPETFLYVTLVSGEGETKVSHATTYHPKPFNQTSLARPNIHMLVTPQEDATQITLTTDIPAFFVHVDSPTTPLHFSDNAITLLPEQPVTLMVNTPFAPTDLVLHDITRLQD